MSMKKIKTKITDKQLQELAMAVLLEHSAGIPTELKAAIRPQYIGGIIKAERTLWQMNDDFPAIPERWARILFAMSLPVRGIAEMDDIGWVSAGIGASAGAGAGSGFVMAFSVSTPVGWMAFAGAGIGVVLVSLGMGGLTAIADDYTTTVGRGQIGQATWDSAVGKYGSFFPEYLDKVMQAIELKKQMEKQLEAYKLNDISVKYNPMAKQHVAVIENFMIGAVLLMKLRLDRYKQGRSIKDTLRYALLAYKGRSNASVQLINEKLGMPSNSEGVVLEFPSRAMIEHSALTKEEKRDLRYVYEAENYEYEYDLSGE